MNTEDRYKRIEQYLSGALKGEDLVAFEKALQTDIALRQELELHRQVSETLKGEKVHQLRNVLKSVDQQWQPSAKGSAAKSSFFTLPKIIGIAASILLLIMAYNYFGGQKADNGKTLFAVHYQPYQMVLNQRSETSTDNELFNNAITSYEKKDFTNAATTFSQLTEKQPDNIAFQFYLALSEISAQQSDKAIPILQNLLQQPTHLFTEQSRWFLGMAYLQRNETGEAVLLLEEIKEGQFKYSEAREVLEALE